jgi:hypothetical protein
MVTGFFALLGFIAVPIGERTGYEHVKAALSTPEGREAVTAVARAYGALRERFFGWAVERLQTSVDPKALLDRRTGDALDDDRTSPSSVGPVVSHDEEGRAVTRGGSRKDTGVVRGQER